MIDRTRLAVLLGLLSLASGLQCPKQKTSPGREVVCYTSASNIDQLTEAICSCTSLVQQGYDVRNLSTSDFEVFRNSLKEINPALQFVISVDDPGKVLPTSGTVRQEIIARLIGILKEVDGVELNMTAGSKERLSHFAKGLKNEMARKSYDKRIFFVLPTKSEDLGKQFDLKELTKYVDLFTIPTHYLAEDDETYRTFHPSRLMGLFDMFNADSLIDLISGLGTPKRKILMSVPASAYRFTLKDQNDNAPRAPTEETQPDIVDQKELCDLLKDGEWTVERDEDLTAPYAFKNKTWIAFEDRISVAIKGKYVLLRELPGLAIHDIENDFKTDCGVLLTREIYHSFSDFKRKSRAAVLNALEDELHQTELEYPTKVKSSNFRVVRVVDTEGHIRVVRENTQTEFTCSRQGYFVHPKSCNRFYRCVKFNQEVEDYSVFEFDCPAGLSFDERTEVCVWPGSMPEGSPCPGSSEIAPVARVRFECPTKPGYYADPQNPRWFFACIDLGGPEVMAYEFRCPYGLIFDEQKLVCEWPWLVQGYSDTAYTRPDYDQRGYGGTGSTLGTGGYYTGGLPHGYTGTTAGIYTGVTAGSGYPGASGASGGGYAGSQGATGYSGSVAGGSGHGISYGGQGSTGYSGGTGSGYSGAGATGQGVSYGGQGSTAHSGGTGSGYSGAGAAGQGVSYGGQGSTAYSGGTGSGYSGAGAAGHRIPYGGQGSTTQAGASGSSYTGTGAGRGTSYGGQGSAGHSGTTGKGQSGSSYDRGTTRYSGSSGSGYSGSGTVIQGGAGHGYTGSGAVSQGGDDHGYAQTSVGGKGGSSGSVYPGSGGHFGSTSGMNTGIQSTGYAGATGTGHASTGTGYAGIAGADHSGASGVYTGTAGTQYTDESGSSGYGSDYSGQGAIGHGTGSVHTGSGDAHGGTAGTIYTVPGKGYSGSVGTGHGGYSGSGTGYSGSTGTVSSGTIHGEYSGTTGAGYSGSAGTGHVGGSIGGQIGTGGIYGGSRGTSHVGSTGGSTGVASGAHGGSTATGFAGSTVGYAGSTAGTRVTTTEGYSGSGVKGGRYPGSSAGQYPGPSYGSTTPGSVGILGSGSTGTAGHGYAGHGVNYPGGQVGSSVPGQNIPFGTHSGAPIYVSTTATGNGYETTLESGIHGQRPGPIFGEKPVPPKCDSACSGATASAGGQTYVTNGYTSGHVFTSGTNVYQGTGGYAGGLNVTLTGSRVPSIGGSTYHGSITPIGGHGIAAGVDTGAIVTGSNVQGSIITEDSTSGTLISHGGTSGSVISGSSDQGSIISGGSYPGYTKTGSGSPGYVISDGVKTTYAGAITPGTVVYGTPSPGIVVTGPPSSGTVVKGQSRPGVVLTGQTAPGVSIGDSIDHGAVVGSTGHHVFTDTGYQTQPGGASPGSSYGTKIGTVSTTYDKTNGYETNEYYDNGGRGTIKFNNGDVTTKYTENDIPDYRPAGGTIPPGSLLPGGKVVAGVSTPSGFTKTGPTKTGFTTATLGAGGSYVISTGKTRPTPSPENIGPKAFEGNVAGYTKTSTESTVKVYPVPGQDYTHVDTSKITLGPSKNTGYSYPTPSIPFEAGVTKNVPISTTESGYLEPATPTPFLHVEVYKTPKAGDSGFSGSPGYQKPSGFTKAPVAYTTGPLENYKTTVYQAAKLPATISTVHPVIDTGYKTIVSSTPLPVTLSGDEYDGGLQTGSQFGFGTKIQQGGYQKGYASSTTPSSVFGVSTKPQFNYGTPTASSGSAYFGSSTKNVFGQGVTSTGASESLKPQSQYVSGDSISPGIGVTYSKPFQLPGVTYQYSTPIPPVTSKTYTIAPTGYNVQSSTPSGGSPTNVAIPRDEVGKLITNYNRGSTKYVPSQYDVYTPGSTSSGVDYSRTHTSSSSTFRKGYGSSTTAAGIKSQSPAGMTVYSGYSRPSSILTYQTTDKTTSVGKAKVIVKWSDLHPLLLGKLGAECTCRGDPFSNLRGPGSKLINSSKGKVDLSNYDEAEIYVDLEKGASYEDNDYVTNDESSSTGPVKIWNNEAAKLSGSSSSQVTLKPSSTYLPSVARSTSLGIQASASALSSGHGFSGSYRSGKSLSGFEATANSVGRQDSAIDRSWADGESEETLDGATNCARPGLFRHPNFCNKFYACHWDEWKKKFTLHVFKCPVHLTFDDGAGACNWPSMGPACQDDNLLV